MAKKSTEDKGLVNELNYRVQELESLYETEEILNDYSSPADEVLQGLGKIIASAFRHSHICACRIEAGDVSVETDNFKTTHLKLTEAIVADGETKGNITVVYTKPVREEKGIFLPNERQFLKAVAAKTGAYLYYKRLRETIEELKNSGKAVVGKEENKAAQWLEKQGIDRDDVASMLKVKINFRKGETIIKQGAIASYIILLVEGLSKNYLEGFQERGFIFKIIKPLNFIGVSALYGDNTFAFSGSALTDCTAYLIDSTLFKNILSKSDLFMKNILNWYCDTTRGHLNRMSSLANKQSLGRFAEMLLYLSEEIFEGPIITTNVSRKDIAELAGISTESGVRFLSDMKKDGIVNIFPNKIEILKPKVLRMIAG